MGLDARQIQEIIPHRPPFLFVDRILELEPGRRGVGLKEFTSEEPFFRGHFPGNPVVPGVLVIEALAQVGCVVTLSLPENRGKLVYFAGINGLRFRRPVMPGDGLRLEVSLTRTRGRVGKGSARATVDGETVVEGELTFVVVDSPERPRGE